MIFSDLGTLTTTRASRARHISRRAGAVPPRALDPPDPVAIRRVPTLPPPRAMGNKQSAVRPCGAGVTATPTTPTLSARDVRSLHAL